MRQLALFKPRTLAAGLLLALLMLPFAGCSKSKSSSKDAISYAMLSILSTFTDNRNGTITSPNGYLIAKCAVGQVWNSSLNNCAGTGSASAYGAQSMAYCLVANSCNDSSLNANSGPAYTACSNYSVSSVTGWRLPSIVELQSLTGSLNRASILTVFPETPDDKYFWSREADSTSTSYSQALGISFAENSFGTKQGFDKVSSALYVRCFK